MTERIELFGESWEFHELRVPSSSSRDVIEELAKRLHGAHVWRTCDNGYIGGSDEEAEHECLMAGFAAWKTLSRDERWPYVHAAVSLVAESLDRIGGISEYVILRRSDLDAIKDALGVATSAIDSAEDLGE